MTYEFFRYPVLLCSRKVQYDSLRDRHRGSDRPSQLRGIILSIIYCLDEHIPSYSISRKVGRELTQ